MIKVSKKMSIESRVSKRGNRKILPSRLSLLSKKNIRRLS